MATAPVERLMMPEPRYVRTTPIEIPAISEPAPRPRSANRRICVQSMRPSNRRRGTGPLSRPRPPPGGRAGLALGGEVARRPQPAGEPFEDALAHVLEELRLVVARSRLRLVLPAVEARRAERLRALEVPKRRGHLRRGDIRDAELVHLLDRGQELAPRDDYPRVLRERRLVELGHRLHVRRGGGVRLVAGERRGDAVDPLGEVAPEPGGHLAAETERVGDDLRAGYAELLERLRDVDAVGRVALRHDDVRRLRAGRRQRTGQVGGAGIEADELRGDACVGEA